MTVVLTRTDDVGFGPCVDARAAVAAFAEATGVQPETYPGGLVEPGLTRRDDLGLNLARVPALFIECANMRNPEDAADVADPEWRRAGITDGVLGYLNSR